MIWGEATCSIVVILINKNFGSTKFLLQRSEEHRDQFSNNENIKTLGNGMTCMRLLKVRVHKRRSMQSHPRKSPLRICISISQFLLSTRRRMRLRKA